jgi:hypothetical protein
MADINLGVGAANSASGSYDIDNSLKLEADNTEYLQKANDSGTNRKTFTVSMWFKRTELSNDYMQLWQGGANGEATRLGFYGGTPKEAIWVDIGGGSGNTGTLYRSYSTQVLRDTSAWYHIVLAVDTTQATEADRFRLWLNGSEVTDWSQRQYPAQNFQCALEASINMTWGAYNATYYKMSGYIAECHYLDGVAKVQTDFGEYDEDSGIWIPKEYTGSYGGNGCYLDFEDSSSLGADQSGNSNNFTLNNIAAADQATDTPTNNFNTFTPLYKYASQATISEGGTSIAYPGAAWRGAKGSIGVINGKWYWEVKSTGGWSNLMLGIQSSNVSTNLNSGNSINHNNSIYIGYGSGNYYYYTGGSQTSNESTGWNSGGDWGSSDIFGFALDLDSATKKFILYRNGSAVNGSGTNLPSAFQDEYLSPFAAGYDASEQYWNFGGYTQMSISSAASDANGYGNFEYAPPSGYYSLCSKNLSEYG